MKLRCAILAAALALVPPAVFADDGGTIVFVSWNVRNYRLQPAAAEGGRTAIPAKPEASREAVVRTLVSLSPDILGLCEIGSAEDLRQLQGRLKRAGLSLPHGTLVPGEDPHRHLALLSRFPLRAIHHDTHSAFEVGGVPRRVQRGFLDCVVEVNPLFHLRLLGAHLKSRRPEPGFDHEEVRGAESRLLRRKVEQILSDDPRSPLLVFGDFNDTKNSPVVRGLLGRRGAKNALTLLPLSDKVGDQWTYCWSETDEYSRIDFVMVSAGLRPRIQSRASGVHRDDDWRRASDHRPLVVTLIPPTPPVP